MEEEKSKTQLEVRREYLVWMTNPVSSLVRPACPAFRIAKYIGYKDLNNEINHFFLEEKNYLILKEGSFEVNKDIMQIYPYDLKTIIKPLNKNGINNLPDEEKSQLLKTLKELGEQI